jgi:cell division protein FtsQ
MRRPLKHFRWLFFGLGPLLSLLLIGASQSQRANRTCSKVHVVLEHRGENFFLDLESVREQIGAHDLILGSRIKDIQLASIEKTMLETRYVDKVHAWFNADGELVLRLWLNNPIARVINESGSSFYIDAQGKVIPTSDQFTARTLLIRGSFTDSTDKYQRVVDARLKMALPVVQELYADSLWSAAVSEVLIDSVGHWSIRAQVGDLRLDMGRLEESAVKLATLREFTRKVLIPQGWNRYRYISLQYANQVVARR